ncbi:hypothetical protein FACS1894104_1520 [Actinomycetota bacterium]|nr:hypothetical protein FACS1894104_1520 [Actinomycetota bacterium]
MNNTNLPVVSILIPVYNVAQYLQQCLESVQAQTFTDFEAICINDGSTDSSLEIIKSFAQKDPRFQVIDKPNSGYGASMNQGLAAARGEYVAILESDDFIDSDMLAVLHKNAKQFDAQVVKANCYFYWSSPKPKNKPTALVPSAQVNRLINPQQQTEIFHLQPSIWSAIYRRDFLEQNQIDFLETPGAAYQDTGFNFKVWTAATRVVFLPDAFLHYRQDNENSSVNSAGKVYCVCDEFNELSAYLDRRPEQKSYLEPILIKMKYETYLWNYERLSQQFQLEFLGQMAQELAEDDAKGVLDLSRFDQWRAKDLQTILESPNRYHQQWLNIDNSQIGRLKHYYKAGGLALVAKIIKHRLSNKQ